MYYLSCLLLISWWEISKSILRILLKNFKKIYFFTEIHEIVWSITFLHSFIIFTLNIFINSLSNNDSNSITIHFMGPQPLLVVSTTGSMTLFTVNLLCRSCFFGSCSYCMNRQFAVNILTMFLPEWNGWNNVFNMVFWDYKRFGFCLKISFWYCQWLKFRVFFFFQLLSGKLQVDFVEELLFWIFGCLCCFPIRIFSRVCSCTVLQSELELSFNDLRIKVCIKGL